MTFTKSEKMNIITPYHIKLAILKNPLLNFLFEDVEKVDEQVTKSKKISEPKTKKRQKQYQDVDDELSEE